jgi:hypothetical protein
VLVCERLNRVFSHHSLHGLAIVVVHDVVQILQSNVRHCHSCVIVNVSLSVSLRAGHSHTGTGTGTGTDTGICTGTALSRSIGTCDAQQVERGSVSQLAFNVAHQTGVVNHAATSKPDIVDCTPLCLLSPHCLQADTTCTC